MQMWELISLLAKQFPPSQAPSVCDVLKYQFKLASKHKEDKSDIELQIARTSCQHLEKVYRDTVLRNVDTKKKDKVFGAFEDEVNRVVSSYQDFPENFNKILNETIHDEQRQTFPFFTLLLLFRAGMPQEALDYCKASSVPEVKHFGETLIAKFIQSSGQLPREEI